MSKKKQKARAKRAIKRARKQQQRHQRRIIMARKPLLPGQIVQFVSDPAQNLKENEWIFCSGIKLYHGKHSVQDLHGAFSSKIKWVEQGEEIVSVNRKDLYDRVALLVDVQKTSFADLYLVLVDEQTWWVTRNDLKGQFNG